MNKTLLLVLSTLIVLSTINYGSKIDYSYSTELGNTLIPGNNYLGRIVFTKLLTNKTSFNISSITNFSYYDNSTNTTINSTYLKLNNLTINSSDSVCNNYNESINILNKSLLSMNSCYELTQGEYDLVGLNTNSSLHVSVLNNVPPGIVLSNNGSAFSLFFSKNNFVMDNDYEVKINVTVPDNTLPGTYLLRYYINDLWFNKTVTVSTVNLWNKTYTQNITDVSVGTNGVLGKVQINNYGNTQELLSLTDNSNGLLQYPRFLMVYPSFPNNFDIGYIINPSNELKNLSYTIYINGSSKQDSIPINFRTIDTTKPEIINETIDKRLEALRPFVYSVNVKDNANISNVYLVFNTTNISYSSKEYNQYFFNLTNKFIGNSIYSVHVIDGSGNELVKDNTYKFDYLHAFKLDYNTGMKKKKFDLDTPGTNFVESDINTPLTVKLLYFEFTPLKPNTTATYSIKVFNANTNFIYKNINDSNTFNVNGNLSLIIKSDMIGDYRGIFELSSITEQASLGNLTFSGSLINYSIPEPFCDNSDISGEICCKPNNVDNIEIATTSCTINKKGLWGKDDMAIPLSVQDRLRFVDLYTSKINNLLNTKTKLIIGLVIFLVLTIMLLIYLLYRIWIRKRIICVIGSSKKVDNNG